MVLQCILLHRLKWKPPLKKQPSRYLRRQQSRSSTAFYGSSTEMCHLDPIKKKYDMCLLDTDGKKADLMHQLSIADDECHPPVALLVKTKESDTLIKAETTETGSVCGYLDLSIGYTTQSTLLGSYLTSLYMHVLSS